MLQCNSDSFVSQFLVKSVKGVLKCTEILILCSLKIFTDFQSFVHFVVIFIYLVCLFVIFMNDLVWY